MGFLLLVTASTDMADVAVPGRDGGVRSMASGTVRHRGVVMLQEPLAVNALSIFADDGGAQLRIGHQLRIFVAPSAGSNDVFGINGALGVFGGQNGMCSVTIGADSDAIIIFFE